MIVEPATDNDRQDILAVTSRIDTFTEEEKETVGELWEERATGYHFLVAREDGQLIGYACYGTHPLTEGTYDLFWIAVDPSVRRRGAGRALLRETESDVRARGGRLILVETSGSDEYAATRSFYESVGYEKEAVLRDFYAMGDNLVFYTHHL